MQSKIKLVVTDIDETLIRANSTSLSRENIRAVKAAREAGVPVTIATGRLYSIARRWAEALDVEDSPVIACNGADVRKNHRTIFSDPVPDSDVAAIYRALEHVDVRKYLFSGDYIYMAKKDRDDVLFAKWTGGTHVHFPIKILDDFDEMMDQVKGNVQKVLIWADDAQRHAQGLEALAPFRETCNVTRGESLNIEINKRGVSKATAVRRIADSYGVGMDEVMAIGDSGNDVEMLKAVGTSVVVRDGMPEAKAVAQYETGTVEENGVAQAIDRFVFGA